MHVLERIGRARVSTVYKFIWFHVDRFVSEKLRPTHACLASWPLCASADTIISDEFVTIEIFLKCVSCLYPDVICPDGFVLVPNVNSCYKLITEPMNWTDASRTCQSMASDVHLATILSKTENDAIITFFETEIYSKCILLFAS